MSIKDKRIVIILATAVLLVIIYHIFTWYGTSVPKYNFKPGEIAQYSIRAPFAFSVLKSEVMIDSEILATLQQYYIPHYIISEEKKFDTIKKIDEFFIDINNIIIFNDSTTISSAFTKSQYFFSDEVIAYLLSAENRNEIYEYLTQRISEVMSQPIIKDEDQGKTIRFSDTVLSNTTQNIRVITLSQAKEQILRNVKNPIQKALISDIIDFYLDSNIIEDTEYLNSEKNNIRKEIDPIITRVEENEYIVIKSNRFTERDILKLQSLSKALEDRKQETNLWEQLATTLGRFLFNLFVLGIFYYVTMFFYRSRYIQFKRILVSYSSFALVALLSCILYSSFKIPYIVLIPIPMFIMVIAFVYSTNYAILFSFFAMITLGQYLNWDMPPLISLTFSSIVCLIVVQRTKQTNYLMIFIYLLLALAGSSVITALYQIESIEQTFIGLFCAFINAIVSVIGTLLIVPVIEKKLGFATKNVLMNLLDYNHPLLKRLSKEAQGTYYHSVIVGNLAEGCAAAISANSLLARVGSYYHDIGKLEHPAYFIENSVGENIHNTLDPLESATFIKNHVKDGVALGKKARLPEQILEIIQQHHGDNKIKYFLHKASEAGIAFDPNDFTYNGPKPRSKEAAIVMIADVIESTVKSATDLSEASIKKIIDDSVANLWLDEQLTDTSISMKELAIIKRTMLPILCSLHRKRIEYPNETK